VLFLGNNVWPSLDRAGTERPQGWLATSLDVSPLFFPNPQGGVRTRQGNRI
jgi:hypothetical protein